MAKQQQTRRKHVPQRTCIACREIAGKRGLIRLVRTPEGVQIDLTGKKLAGRGAYLHPQQRCWRQALENRRIEQALRTKLSAADRERLEAFMVTLPETVAESTAEDDA